MSDRYLVIADSIKYQPHTYAFDIWMQQFFRRLDVSKLLIYMVDTVSIDVLPILANEFDVMGNKGWNFCETEDEQRALIKQAVQLHRYKGTPWAIEQVIEQAGLTGAVLMEGVGTDPDTGWAVFRIVPPVETPSDPAVNEKLVALVNVYKNARSVFEGVLYPLIYDGTYLYDGTRHHVGTP